MLKKKILLHSLLCSSLIFSSGPRKSQPTEEQRAHSLAHFSSVVAQTLKDPKLTSARTPESVIEYLNQSSPLNKAMSWLDQVPNITIANQPYHYKNGQWKHTPKRQR